jgi:hypothetical protein
MLQQNNTRRTLTVSGRTMKFLECLEAQEALFGKACEALFGLHDDKVADQLIAEHLKPHFSALRAAIVSFMGDSIMERITNVGFENEI